MEAHLGGPILRDLSCDPFSDPLSCVPVAKRDSSGFCFSLASKISMM